jgi:tetrahydrodipicolinate N-acetyltransferase
MNAEEIIHFIKTSKKTTIVKVYLNGDSIDKILYPSDVKTFAGQSILIGEWSTLKPILEENASRIFDIYIENEARNQAVSLLDTKDIKARIEPGAIIRDRVEIGDNAVIMMGAVINIGAVIGEGTMIDMNAVLGGRAIVGANCHIGAGTVLAGVVEPASATPVVIEDDVLIGANAVVLEGVKVGKGSVIGAGSIVTHDIPPFSVAFGSPARVIKEVDQRIKDKTEILQDLRNLD